MTKHEHGKWHPMELAPRDGTRILLMMETNDKRRVEMGRYEDDKHAKRPRPYWSRQTTEYASEMRSNVPMAWMTLPSTEDV